MEYFELELGDVFQFHGIMKGVNLKFAIDNEGRTNLLAFVMNDWRSSIQTDLELLLKTSKDDIEIIEKAPFIPKLNEMYFHVDNDGDVSCCVYQDMLFDILNFKLRNCFKTEEKAEKNKKRILNILKSDKMLVEIQTPYR